MPSETRNEIDQALQEKVMRELEWDPKVNAAHIGVSAQDGSITLTGKVRTYTERIEARKAAERVRDVRTLADEIEVKLSHPHRRDDSEIAEAASRALGGNDLIPKGIKAEVNDGGITLQGGVQWGYQRDAAERAVRHLTGVRMVSNQINVKPPDSQPRDIDALIKAAFVRSARLDACEIEVTMSDGTAHLSGRVHSIPEMTAAVKAAASAPGVSHIDNRLVVVR